jgi:DNA-3-methyladenine glycosylase
MNPGERLGREFYIRDVLQVAPDLIGKRIAMKKTEGSIMRYTITEVEAYRGEEDKACHASKGRTSRTDILYHEGGRLYTYFIYGMYWMLNIVTGLENEPQAALIRGLEGITGPGRITKALGIDRSFYGEDVVESGKIWVEETGMIHSIKTSPRIGVDYSGEYWRSKPWRYFI